MTLSKPFMVWATALDKTSSRYYGIRWRFPLLHLLLIAVILGVSTSAVYRLFSQSRHQQLNDRLLTLVQSAALSLPMVKSEERQSLDSTLPWHDLFSNQEQSLEWFDAEGELLTAEGEPLADIPLPKDSLLSKRSRPLDDASLLLSDDVSLLPSDDGLPSKDELSLEDELPPDDESLSEDELPPDDESLSEDGLPSGDEPLSEDALLLDDEAVLEDGLPSDGEPLSEDALLSGNESLSEDKLPSDDESLSEDALLSDDEAVLEDGLPSDDASKSAPLIEQQEQRRIVTIAVYHRSLDGKTIALEGFLRASQSTQKMEESLLRLRLGLGGGSLLALLLTGVSSLHLTRQVTKPIMQKVQLLSQFSAGAVQELQSPLQRISTATELMHDRVEPLEPADVGKLRAIEEATDQMKTVMGDVLFLIQTGATQTSPVDQATVLLNDLLRTVVERFEKQARLRGVSVKDQLLTQVSVVGNPTQLECLFSNLLESALGYTETKGQVFLSARKHRQDAVITIKDSGYGIPPEHLPLVFQWLLQTESERSKNPGKSGLELAIAQAIARQHGGEISVNSQVGVGNCFQVRLPLA